MNKLELLSPAGDWESFCAAIQYGADAVYLGLSQFSLRAQSKNFSPDMLKQAVIKAHAQGVSVYLACNIVFHNKQMDAFEEALETAKEAGVDALIVSDLGAMAMARAFGLPVHVSTQAGVANYRTANALYELGAKRVVLARELTLQEITDIRRRTTPELELEAFVHGAMCMSYSGRCVLSSYLTGRDANQGDCAQPCRWKYRLVEEKRPGQYFPIEEDGKFSYILNSRDLCMIEHLPELKEAGVTSFKLEGRAKSAVYTATITNAYRIAIDHMNQHSDLPLPEWVVEETKKASHRTYSTGFYFGGEPGQETESGGYVRTAEVVGIAQGWENGVLTLSQRNKFCVGESLEVMEPAQKPWTFTVESMWDKEEQPIVAAPHPQMDVKLTCERPVCTGAMIRRNIDV